MDLTLCISLRSSVSKHSYALLSLGIFSIRAYGSDILRESKPYHFFKAYFFGFILTLIFRTNGLIKFFSTGLKTKTIKATQKARGL